MHELNTAQQLAPIQDNQSEPQEQTARVDMRGLIPTVPAADVGGSPRYLEADTQRQGSAPHHVGDTTQVTAPPVMDFDGKTNQLPRVRSVPGDHQATAIRALPAGRRAPRQHDQAATTGGLVSRLRRIRSMDSAPGQRPRTESQRVKRSAPLWLDPETTPEARPMTQPLPSWPKLSPAINPRSSSPGLPLAQADVDRTDPDLGPPSWLDAPTNAVASAGPAAVAPVTPMPVMPAPLDHCPPMLKVPTAPTLLGLPAAPQPAAPAAQAPLTLEPFQLSLVPQLEPPRQPTPPAGNVLSLRLVEDSCPAQPLPLAAPEPATQLFEAPAAPLHQPAPVAIPIAAPPSHLATLPRSLDQLLTLTPQQAPVVRQPSPTMRVEPLPFADELDLSAEWQMPVRRRRNQALVGVLLALVGMALVVGLVYWLSLVPAAPPTGGVVEVHSIPPGAAVTVDGRAVHKATPVKVKVKDLEQAHSVKVVLKGYQVWQDTVTLPGDDPRVRVFAILDQAAPEADKAAK